MLSIPLAGPRLVLGALLLASAPAVAQSPAAPSPAAGDWAGEIVGTGLTIVFHVTEADGALAATFDVPLQDAAGVPAGRPTLAGDSLTIPVPLVVGGFAGRLAGDTVTGTWTQGGASLPLVLARVAPGVATALPPRADTPVGPFPYRDEAITVASAPGVALAGTLTVPDGTGPFPGVVLVSGSGPQDRDEALLGHRPFLVLADFLARRGIAVLRYDDRGVAASTGAFAGATTADFAVDAQAAVQAMAARADIASVGIVGHSEGGLVAPMAANVTDAVELVVLLAGPAVPGRDVLRFQLARGLSASSEGLAAYDAALAAALDTLAAGRIETAATRASATFEAATAGIGDADRALLSPDAFDSDGSLAQMAEPWMRAFIAYDPVPALRALRVPAFAVFGATDQQVRALDNVPAMRSALAGAPAGSAVLVLPGLNHLFQPSASGDGAEYGRIDTSFSPVMMTAVADWIAARTRP